MTFLDTLIINRDRITNLILSINPNLTLNSRGFPAIGTPNSHSLAREIKNTLNQIKTLAFSEDGNVDYQIIIQHRLYQAHKELAGEMVNFDINDLRSTSEKTAFWINLYNALVIDAVIQENVRKSVTESRLGIMSFFQRAAYQVNGLRFSLNDIEHGLLRSNRGFPYLPGPHFAARDPRLKAVISPVDPRIHFALNCASISCPPISVYTPEDLDQQLDLAARNFINNNLIPNRDQNTLSISKIFKWYQADFGGRKEIIPFLLDYIQDQQVRRWLSENHHSIQIKYLPYDWGLNRTNA